MEQLLLTSKNLAKAKIQSKGTLSISDLLSKIEQLDHVQVNAELPKQDLILHWEECFTPTHQLNGFNELLSSKLYSYKFQYLGSFSYGEQELRCGGTQDSDQACETFAANMAHRKVYQSVTEASERCNCTWLIDMLLNAEHIGENTLRNETLIWQSTGDAFEFVLQSQKGHTQERQVIRFFNAFEQVAWQHQIFLKS